MAVSHARKPTALAVAPAIVLFAILVAHSMLETARDALFLARLGAERLAVAYLAIAAFAMLAIVVVRRGLRMRDPRRVLVAFLVLATVGTAVLASAIATSRTLVFVLYVWTGFVATLVVPSFWTAIDRSLELRDAKRVFGAIGAGGVVGAMAGSALASVLGRVLPATQLVTAGAVAFALATIAAIWLVPRERAPEPAARRARQASRSIQARRYMRLLLGFGVISTAVLTLGDLTFKRVMAEHLAPEQLATWFGAIYTVLNAIALAIQVVVTPKLFARWGVGAALAVLPLIVVSTAFGFALTGALIAVIALKLGDGGFRHSLHRVASEILYLPVPAAIRDGGKLVADALGQRGGQAIAALVAGGFAIAGVGARPLGMLAAATGIAWLAVVAITRRAYVAQLHDADHDEQIGAELLASGDPTAMRGALHVLARAPELAEVERLIALLADRRLRADVRRALIAVGDRALDALIAALSDPATPAAVRRHLPRTLMRFHSRRAAAALVGRVLHEPDDITQMKLLRALGRMRDEEPRLRIEALPLRQYLRRAVRDAVLAAPDKRRIALERVFRVLGILHPRAGARDAWDALVKGEDVAALELVESLAPIEVRAPLLALLDAAR